MQIMAMLGAGVSLSLSLSLSLGLSLSLSHDDARRDSGGGVYWWPFFWVFWLCPCGYYGYGYYGTGYYGRYNRALLSQSETEEQQQGLVQGQPDSTATRRV